MTSLTYQWSFVYHWVCLNHISHILTICKCLGSFMAKSVFTVHFLYLVSTELTSSILMICFILYHSLIDFVITERLYSQSLQRLCSLVYLVIGIHINIGTLLSSKFFKDGHSMHMPPHANTCQEGSDV